MVFIKNQKRNIYIMNLDHKSSLSDIPFSEEVNDFGTERYVNGLIKFIENSSAPITIALQGE